MPWRTVSSGPLTTLWDRALLSTVWFDVRTMAMFQRYQAMANGEDVGGEPGQWGSWWLLWDCFCMMLSSVPPFSHKVLPDTWPCVSWIKVLWHEDACSAEGALGWAQGLLWWNAGRSCRHLHSSSGTQSSSEGLLEKFVLQMTLKLFMQYPHAFCRYRYNYFIMLSCEVWKLSLPILLN